MTLNEDITAFLASKGLGTKAVNLFEGEFPPTPDDAMYVREYGGGPPLHTKDGPPAFRYPRFSVVTRSKSARAARMRLEDAVRHLSGFSGVLSGTGYRIRALREPAPMGRDGEGRERVSADFEATR